MFFYTLRSGKLRLWGVGLGTLVALVAVLRFPLAAAAGVRRGLSLCGQTVIPTLFPFLILSGFAVRSGLCDVLGKKLGRLPVKLFHLPACTAAAILIGFIGGYPAGAAAAGELVRSGRLTREQGKRLLTFCVNGGPAFVLSTVGAGLLGSSALGWLLLGIHWGTALLLGLLTRGAPSDAVTPAAPVAPLSVGVALTESVTAACRSLLSMCGFITAASAVLFVASAAGIPASLSLPLSCLLEVSCGCIEAVSAGPLAPFWLGAALGFGGLSVHGQVAVCAAELIDRHFFTMRLLHGVLSGLLALWLFRYVPVSVTVFAVAGGQIVEPFVGSSVTGGLALLAVCVLYLLGVRRPSENP